MTTVPKLSYTSNSHPYYQASRARIDLRKKVVMNFIYLIDQVIYLHTWIKIIWHISRGKLKKSGRKVVVYFFRRIVKRINKRKKSSNKGWSKIKIILKHQNSWVQKFQPYLLWRLRGRIILLRVLKDCLKWIWDVNSHMLNQKSKPRNNKETQVNQTRQL